MILVSLASLVFPALVLQQDPGWELASQMPPVVRRALHEQSRWRYTGTRSATLKRKSELIEYTEYITRDGSNLRIDYPSDSRNHGKIIVETASDRRQFDERTNKIHVTPPRREPLFDHIRGAWRGEHALRVTEEDGPRVASLPSRLVKVFDGKGNCLQELNIEPHSGVVLARRVFDAVGSLVGSFEFKEINLHPNIDPSVFNLRRLGATIVTPEDDLRSLVAGTEFLPVFLPASTGLQLDSTRIRDVPGTGQKMLMSQYVSPRGRIFLFQLSVGVDPKTMERNAPKNIHSVTEKIQGRWFVMVGPMDEQSLRRDLSTLE